MKQNFAWTIGKFEIDGDFLWFVPHWLNVLCKYNLLTRKIEQVISFPKTTIFHRGFFNVKKIKDYILVVPSWEENIYLYHILSGKMKKFKLREKIYTNEKLYLCGVFSEKVFLFPIEYDYIVKLDVVNELLEEIPCSPQMFISSIQKEEKIYLVNMTNELFVFDMKTEKLKVEWSCDCNKEFRTIIDSNFNTVILIDMIGNILFFDIDKKKIIKQIRFNHLVYSGICMESKVFLFPEKWKNPFVLNLSNYQIKELEFVKENFSESSLTIFSEAIMIEKKIYIMHTTKQCLFIIDSESEKFEEVYIKIGELNELLDELLDVQAKKEPLLEETGHYVSFEYLMNKINTKKDRNNFNLEIGKKIFLLMK